MGNYGMNIVVMATDNASSTINRIADSVTRMSSVVQQASASLNQVSQLGAFSFITDKMGDYALDAGKSIMSLYGKLVDNVKNTGQEFQSFRVTLKAMYQDAELAESKIQQLIQFAAHSPFDVGDVKNMLITLKSQGIDAFDAITSSAGNTQQALAWVSDMMAFKPDIPIYRWKLAFQNYIGSGQQLVLRNALDMGNISQILGHDIGTTPQERFQDIVEIVEKTNLRGLSEGLVNTWQGMLSNLNDVFTQFYLSIADSGVFSKLEQAFKNIVSPLLQLSPERIATFGQTIGGALNVLIKPVEMLSKALGALIQGFIDLTETNPRLVQFLTLLGSFVGIGLITTGVVLKLASAFSGLFMIVAIINQMGGLGNVIATVRGLGSSLMVAIRTSILPFIAAIGLLYAAWKLDFLGIRTITTSVLKDIGQAFTTAKNALNLDLQGMMNIFNSSNGLTRVLMKLGILIRAVAEGWKTIGDNEHELSNDTWFKVQALGMESLLFTIFSVKDKLLAFWHGFKDGLLQIRNFVVGIFDSIRSVIKGTVLEGIFNALTGGLDKLLQVIFFGTTADWKALGEHFATFFVIFFGARKVIGVISGLSSVLGVFGRVLGSLFRVIAGANIAAITNIFRALFAPLGLFTGGGGGSGAGGAGSGGAGAGGRLVNLLTNVKAVSKIMLSLVSAVGIFMAAVTLFGVYMIPFEGVMKNGVKGLQELAEAIPAFVGIILGISASFAMLQKLNLFNGGFINNTNLFKGNMKKILFNMVSLFEMIGLFAAFTGVIGLLTSAEIVSDALKQGVETLKVISEALLMAMPAVAGLTALTGVMNKFAISKMAVIKATLMFDAVVFLITGLATVLGALNINGDLEGVVRRGIDVIRTVSELINLDFVLRFGILTAACIALGTIASDLGKTIGAILKGLAYIGEVVGIVTAVMLAVGSIVAAIESVPGLQKGSVVETINRAFDVLVAVTEGVGRAVGALAGGFIGQFSASTITIIGDAIVNLVTKIQPLLDLANGGVDINALNRFFNAVSNFMVGVMSSAFLSGFVGGNAMRDLGEQLNDFARYMTSFYNRVAGINEAGIEKSSKIFESLQAINGDTFKMGGLKVFAEGSYNFPQIGQQLSEFASSMKQVYDDFAVVNMQGVENSPKIFESLYGINNAAFRFGGLSQAIEGFVYLPQIGAQLSSFIRSAKDFYNEVAKIDDGTVNKVKTLMESLEVLSNFKTGGIFSESIDLSSWGKQLSKFTESMKGFFKDVMTFSDVAFERAKKLFNTLEEMNLNSLAGNTGNINKIINNSSFEKLAKQLNTFANEMSTFFGTVRQFSESDMNKAISLVNSLKGFGEVYEAVKGFEGGVGLFGKQLNTFADNLKTFADKMTEIKDFKSIFLMVKTNLAEYISFFTDLKSQLDTALNGIADSYQTFGQRLNDSVWEINNNVIGGLTEMQSSLDAPIEMFKQFAESVTGITDSISGLSTSLTDMINALSDDTKYDFISGHLTGVANALKDFKKAIDEGGLDSYKSILSGISEAFDGFASKMQNFVNSAEENASSITNLTSALTGLKEVANLSLSVQISSFGDTLVRLGGQLAIFKDTLGVVGGEGGLVSYLEDISKALSTFATNLKDVASESMSTSANNMRDLASALYTLVAIKDSLSSASENIKTFAQNLNDFSGIMKQIVDKIALDILASQLQGLFNVLNQWGWLGDAIATMGNFRDVLNGIRESALSLQGGVLATLGSDFESLGSSLSKFVSDAGGVTGDGGLSQIGESIRAFGDAFSSAYEQINGYTAQILTSVQEMVTGISTSLDDMSSKIDTVINNIITGSLTKFENSWSSVKSNVIGYISGISGSMSTLSATTASAFTQMASVMATKAAEIKSTLSSLASAANNTIIAPKVSMPSTSYSAPWLPIGISQRATGGVFNRPSIIELAENGSEAVVPLENNTEWIDKVAYRLMSSPKGQYFNSQTNRNSGSVSNDYSIHIEQGAIVIQANDGANAQQLAEQIMYIIKRKAETKSMLNYGR